MSSIDVVIPNYNYGQYLRESVASVLSQDVALRLLIVDNASTDDSPAIARELAAGDTRIHLNLRPQNLGGQASFNEANTWAEARYLLILCSDDILAPGTLHSAMGYLDAHPDAVFAYGREAHYWTGAPLPWDSTTRGPSYELESGRAFLEARCAGVRVDAGTVIVRTEVQKRAGLFDPRLPYTDDLEMLLRLSSYGPVAHTESLHGVRRQHARNASRVFLSDRVGELSQWLAAFEVHFEGRGRLEPDHLQLVAAVRRRIASQALRWSVRALANGQLTEAKTLARGAAKFAPDLPLVGRAAPVLEMLRRR